MPLIGCLPGLLARAASQSAWRRCCPPRELDVGGKTGAAWGEKSPNRLAQRNGYRDRIWETRAGTVELRIPKLRPRQASDADLALMQRIDELHLELPFAGSRMLRDLLAGEDIEVGRLHVATLMKRMGIEALYRKPNTSKPAPGHKIYPYLLRRLPITRANQVWAMDITYVPMARGFVYLTAVVDWFSRRVLAWRLSITMHADFCIEALEEALARFGKPEIFNTDPSAVC